MQIDTSAQVSHLLKAYSVQGATPAREGPGPEEAGQKVLERPGSNDPRLRVARGQDSLEISSTGRDLLNEQVNKETDPVERAKLGDAAAARESDRAAVEHSQLDEATRSILSGKVQRIDLLA